MIIVRNANGQVTHVLSRARGELEKDAQKHGMDAEHVPWDIN
jgi:hypothetical protein